MKQSLKINLLFIVMVVKFQEKKHFFCTKRMLNEK